MSYCHDADAGLASHAEVDGSPDLLEALKALLSSFPIEGACTEKNPFGQCTATLSDGTKVDRYDYAKQAIEHAEKSIVVCNGTLYNGPEKRFVRCGQCGAVDYEQNEGDRCQAPLPTLAIDLSRFQETGPEEDPGARLLLTVSINGVPHHMEAWAVHETDDGQESVAWTDRWIDIYRGVGGEGPWLTMDFNGREYTLIITPHCD